MESGAFQKDKIFAKSVFKARCRVGTDLNFMVLSFQHGVCRVGDVILCESKD